MVVTFTGPDELTYHRPNSVGVAKAWFALFHPVTNYGFPAVDQWKLLFSSNLHVQKLFLQRQGVAGKLAQLLAEELLLAANLLLLLS